MLQATSTEVKNHFGEYLEKASREPVAITKTGRTSAVILSFSEYSRLQQLEDELWALRALQAEKSGYIGTHVANELLKG